MNPSMKERRKGRKKGRGGRYYTGESIEGKVSTGYESTSADARMTKVGTIPITYTIFAITLHIYPVSITPMCPHIP